jgi:pSer/pThr/pTyr-binding forkhead associated (FHA) protein
MHFTPRAQRHSTTTPSAGRYLALEQDGELTFVALMADVTRLGRSLSADIELDHPSVSRRHALISREDGRLMLLDDHSLNGSYLNGRRVERAVLEDGDVIELGTVRLHFAEVAERATDPLHEAVAA